MRFIEASKTFTLNKSTYINLRWFAYSGQIFAILIVQFFFQFNFDYFYPFDQNDFNEIDKKKSIILPYYTRAEFYKKNYFEKFKYLRNNNKKLR